MSHISVAHIKVAYFYLMFYAIPRAFFRSSHSFSICYSRNCSRATRVITNLILSILVLNFLLIGIVNPSLLNPGPNELKVYYQNVQGLLPFKELDQVQPKLIETKIFEINSYVNKHKPHVVMLNETWLKKSIGNRAIIEDPCYALFRLDRSKLSHPPDPDNPNKYRKYGGGVLVAFRTDIKDMEFKRLSACKGCELAAFEMTLNEKKCIICTVNLSSISWPLLENQCSSNPIEKLFVESFTEKGLDQCITEPTHNKGRTLDLLLTNNQSLISNLQVLEKDSICRSDHFPITFDIKPILK